MEIAGLGEERFCHARHRDIDGTLRGEYLRVGP
jgi:hypothetical protein